MLTRCAIICESLGGLGEEEGLSHRATRLSFRWAVTYPCRTGRLNAPAPRDPGQSRARAELGIEGAELSGTVRSGPGSSVDLAGEVENGE